MQTVFLCYALNDFRQYVRLGTRRSLNFFKYQIAPRIYATRLLQRKISSRPRKNFIESTRYFIWDQ